MKPSVTGFLTHLCAGTGNESSEVPMPSAWQASVLSFKNYFQMKLIRHLVCISPV